MALHKLYGDGPLHLIAAIASLAIAGYAFLEIAGGTGALSFVVFFAGAIVAHDLIAFPIYSALDRIGGRAESAAGIGDAINYIRVPALLSGFGLVVWFPLILALADQTYLANSGHAPADFLGRWLALTAILFLASGVIYAIRRRARGRDRATGPRGARNRR